MSQDRRVRRVNPGPFGTGLAATLLEKPVVLARTAAKYRAGDVTPTR
ncbi:MAG: hypothetical protein AAF334_04790 [Pseudomonadota bacterium]